MPAPLELHGQRFGALTAIARAAYRGRSGWRCRCDCGRETIVPTNRLSVADDDRRAVRACEFCRSRQCVICGAWYLKSGSAATCGSENCRLENRRIVNARAAAHAELRNPGQKARRSTEYRRKLRVSRPDRYAALLESDREAQRRRWATLSPEDREAVRAYRREYYAANRESLREKFLAWLESLPPERRQEWDRRVAQAGRSYRRRRALAEMMNRARIVIERTGDDE